MKYSGQIKSVLVAVVLMFLVGCDSSADFEGEWIGRPQHYNPAAIGQANQAARVSMAIKTDAVVIDGESVEIVGRHITKKGESEYLVFTTKDSVVQFKILTANQLRLEASQAIYIDFSRDG